MNAVQFAHISIVAKDWKLLSQFYIDAFGCVPTSANEFIAGEWLEKMTNIGGVKLEGIQLSLPGCDDGPKLYIHSANHLLKRRLPPQINDTGLSYIAFTMDDIKPFIARVLQFGGRFYGEIVDTQIDDSPLKLVLMRDPEGNIVELQSKIDKKAPLH
jgi:predicted enzyme related to lactoylglutathione lyase